MMDNLNKISIFFLLVILSTAGMRAQDSLLPKNAWGVDILLSTNGIGLGTFYRHEYTDNLSGFIDFSISEASDEREISYVDYWTGMTYVPGKVNRFLVIPLFIGAQYRLFKDEILDNFRPYVNAAIGPSLIYVFPYDEEYITALGKGRPRYTAGGYIGFGAFFGSERSTLMGLNLRYYFVPYSGGIISMYNTRKSQFGGLYLSLSFGSAW